MRWQGPYRADVRWRATLWPHWAGCALLAATLAWLALLLSVQVRSDLPWLLLVPGLMWGGWHTLSRSCRPLPVDAMARTFSLGTLGMLIGLAWDTRAAGLQLAVTVCSAGVAGGAGAAFWLHLSCLPAMHAGMLAGALPTRRYECAQGQVRYQGLRRQLGCCAAMFLGMSAGGVLAVRVAPHAVAMLGGMFGGMVWGMVAHALAGRAGVWLKQKIIITRE